MEHIVLRLREAYKKVLQENVHVNTFVAIVAAGGTKLKAIKDVSFSTTYLSSIYTYMMLSLHL